jgi:hypothetical protein
MKKACFFVCIVAFGLYSCTNNTTADIEAADESQKRSNLAAGGKSDEELRAAAEKRREEERRKEEERLAKMTSMEITPKEFDFGKIPKEIPVTTKFTIKNTGDKPLIIQEAQASCGCTVPKKPEQPIPPGESEELEVTFTSKPDQAGQIINKNITISANIEELSQRVIIKGKVDE